MARAPPGRGRAPEPVENLSLGNQQRVQLAAALVHDPELLVLDEPFSGLDPVGVDVLGSVLVEEARSRGVPVLFSSHQLELVERLCDAAAILADGRLVAAGPVTELNSSRTGRRFRIEVDAPDDQWLGNVRGAVRVERGLVDLTDGADSQALLDAARAAGPVRHFAPESPSLAELFREAVAAGGAPERERDA
jgi:ABC-2 type transport system ATP-binding protein